MSNYTVYMHISPSGKRYIGITSTSVNQRWNNGKGYETQIFYRAIEKYGWDNIEHIIIAKELTKEEAEWLEIELIRELDTTNPSKGYNVAKGGEGTNGCKHTEEWKQAMSERVSGENHPMFGSHRNGELNPMFGKHHTKETRQKLSELRLGKTHTEETKYRISEALKGRVVSEETIQKMSGENHPRARKVICVTTNEIFDTLTEGAKKYNIGRTSDIANCCKGYKIVKGKKRNVNYCGKLTDGTPLVWKYYDEYLKEQEQNGVA